MSNSKKKTTSFHVIARPISEVPVELLNASVPKVYRDSLDCWIQNCRVVPLDSFEDTSNIDSSNNRSLKQKEKVIIIDCRKQSGYIVSHIPNAFNFPTTIRKIFDETAIKYFLPCFDKAVEGVSIDDEPSFGDAHAYHQLKEVIVGTAKLCEHRLILVFYCGTGLRSGFISRWFRRVWVERLKRETGIVIGGNQGCRIDVRVLDGGMYYWGSEGRRMVNESGSRETSKILPHMSVTKMLVDDVHRGVEGGS